MNTRRLLVATTLQLPLRHERQRATRALTRSACEITCRRRGGDVAKYGHGRVSDRAPKSALSRNAACAVHMHGAVGGGRCSRPPPSRRAPRRGRAPDTRTSAMHGSPGARDARARSGGPAPPRARWTLSLTPHLTRGPSARAPQRASCGTPQEHKMVHCRK